jgi:RNA polymerase sigma-70 factor, ECF subfamily
MSGNERQAGSRVPVPEAAEVPSSEDSDRVRRAMAGDAQAFEELYTKYRPAVFKVAYGVTGNVEDALDVTQETFLKAHRSLELFEGRASVLTWLCQIAIHRAIDLQRRKKVRRAVGLEDYMTPAGVKRPAGGRHAGGAPPMAAGARADAAQDPDATPAQPPRMSQAARVPVSMGPQQELDPALMASGNELKTALDKALAELSEKHRTVFLLYTVKGLSYKEIADALSISIGTVMSRLFYARKNLQGLLAEFAS